jgi:hypothetical protein
VLYNPINVNNGDFIHGDATATGSVVTIPANKWFSVSIQLSASVTIAGAATPRVIFNTTGSSGFFPPNANAVVARLSMSGLALVSVQSDGTMEFAGYSGNSSISLDFNSGGASTASCIINGYTMG